jgi:integrase
MRRLLDREIYPEYGDHLVAAIDTREALAYDKKLLRRGLSESGAANVQKPLRGLLDHAVLTGDIAVNPYRQIPRGKLSSCNTKREHHESTTEEIERFIATAQEFDLRDAARRKYADQVEFMVRYGPRIAEASGIKPKDLEAVTKVKDGEEYTLYFVNICRQFTKRGEVVERVKTKSSARRIPITKDMYDKLRFRQSFYGLSDDDFLFADRPGGNPPSHSNFRRRAWNRIVKETGIQLKEGVRFTPHDARHACASQLGTVLDSKDVAAVLGHSSAKTTESIYQHVFDRDKQDDRIRAAMEAARNGGQS